MCWCFYKQFDVSVFKMGLSVSADFGERVPYQARQPGASNQKGLHKSEFLNFGVK